MLKACATCSRIVRKPDGTFYIWIEVFRDSKGSYHRALPDFLLKYKHYTVQTIECALDEDIDMDLYDQPSDSTKMRWNSWLYHSLYVLWYAILISSILTRCYSPDAEIFENGPETLLQKFRTIYKRNVRKKVDYCFRNGWLIHLVPLFYIFSNDFEFFRFP